MYKTLWTRKCLWIHKNIQFQDKILYGAPNSVEDGKYSILRHSTLVFFRLQPQTRHKNIVHTHCTGTSKTEFKSDTNITPDTIMIHKKLHVITIIMNWLRRAQSCVLPSTSVLKTCIEDILDTPCLRDVDSPSQRLLRGESTLAPECQVEHMRVKYWNSS